MMAITVKLEANTVEEAIQKVEAIHNAFGSVFVDVELHISAGDNSGTLNTARPSDKFFNNEEATTMVGAIQFANFAGLTSLPQKVASAASAIETSELVGASYEPIFYAGAQPVRGTNYWFLALQTLTTNPIKRRIVKMAVNEFNGKFEIVKDSIKVVFE